jgi:hypothetical protein
MYLWAKKGFTPTTLLLTVFHLAAVEKQVNYTVTLWIGNMALPKITHVQKSGG